MNEIRYTQAIKGKTYTFSDETGALASGGIGVTYFSPLGDELRAAQYKIPVIYMPRTWSVTADDFLKSFRRGDRVELITDGATVGVFAATAITGGTKLQGGRYSFDIEGTDFAGMCINVPHKGGLFANNQVSFFDVLEEFKTPFTLPEYDDDRQIVFLEARMGPVGISYDVANAYINGWLPYEADLRENLRRMMQLVGAYETVAANMYGFPVPLITRSRDGIPAIISPYDTHSGGAYQSFERPATVEAIEHGYLKIDTVAAAELYDTQVGVSRALVTFDGPHHSLDGGGLTINESGANYAIVSGIGTLPGKPYVRTERRISRSVTGGSGGTKTMDNPLVTDATASAMLDRMVNYYEHASLLSTAYTSPDEQGAGRLVQVEDPVGDNVRGYVSSCTMTYSGINKANTEIAVGWSPISGAIYSEQIIVDNGNVLDVPAGVTRMRLTLIQGGKGGWGGYQGGSATVPPGSDYASQAGAGGDPGEGGDPGKVYQIDIDMDGTAQSVPVTVGSPGSPGAADHGEGTEGGHSTATIGGTTYTSADGIVRTDGIVVGGQNYAVTGPAGVYAGKPGEGPDTLVQTLSDDATSQTGEVTTWRTGAGRVVSGGAHGGGGPAYGSDGQNAGSTYPGSGADAVLDGFNGYTAPVGSYGSGGIGGNGGGGGGASTDPLHPGGGSGGHGSPGGAGAQGAVIAQFAYGDTPAPMPTPNWLYSADSQQLYDYYFEPLAAAEED